MIATARTAELSADVRAWEREGVLGLGALMDAFPLSPACEFPHRPMHGCECNGCLGHRLDAPALA